MFVLFSLYFRVGPVFESSSREMLSFKQKKNWKEVKQVARGVKQAARGLSKMHSDAWQLIYRLTYAYLLIR